MNTQGWTSAAILGIIISLGYFAVGTIQTKLDVVREGVKTDVTTALQPVVTQQEALAKQVRVISDAMEKLEAERKPRWPRAEDQQ